MASRKPSSLRHGTQPAPRPTAALRADNDAILGVLRVVTRALDDGGRFEDLAFWRAAVSFLQRFADHAHHRKEEAILIPPLETCGLPRESGPIACIQAEHEQARVLLRTLTGLLPGLADSAEVQDRFYRVMREYCAFLALHINRENGVLLPLADRLLSAADSSVGRQRLALGEYAADGGHELLALAERTQPVVKRRDIERGG